MRGGSTAYICFNRAFGYMNEWMDAHRAGAKRNHAKAVNPDEYQTGHGPQGDVIRNQNYVRLIRAAN